MLCSIEGTFRDGRVELAETPPGMPESRVIVTFLGPAKEDAGSPAASYEGLIVNRGRGPQIASSRITVYDIMDYRLEGWEPRRIAQWFRLREEEVLAAFQYIDEHTAEVETTYREILERNARAKNSPEVEAKLVVSRQKIREWFESRKARTAAIWRIGVPNLLADVNAEGHLRAIVHLLECEPRAELWDYLGMTAETFASQRLDRESTDERDLVLVTGNRNQKSDDSLEAAIRLYSGIDSWPVVTIGDPRRLLRDLEYANRAADALLTHLIDIETRRGAGRLYIP